MKKLANRVFWMRLLGVMLLLITSAKPPVFAAGAASASKTPLVKMTVNGGKLSAQIKAAPLRAVIMEVSRLTGAEVFWLSRRDEDLVSANFSELPLNEALERILNTNFALSYMLMGNDRKLAAIRIGSRSEFERKSGTTTTLSIIREAYPENTKEPAWPWARKDVTARIERNDWRPEPTPVDPLAEMNLAEPPPYSRPDNRVTCNSCPERSGGGNDPFTPNSH